MQIFKKVILFCCFHDEIEKKKKNINHYQIGKVPARRLALLTSLLPNLRKEEENLIGI